MVEVKSEPSFFKKQVLPVLVLALFISIGIAKVWPITHGGWMLSAAWKEPVKKVYDSCSFDDYSKPNFNGKKCEPLCAQIAYPVDGFPFATRRAASSCDSATNDLGRFLNHATLFIISIGISLLLLRLVKRLRRSNVNV